jgi:hypothetical protein
MAETLGAPLTPVYPAEPPDWMVTLLLLLMVSAADGALVVGATEPLELMVMSPDVAVFSGVVVALPTVVCPCAIEAANVSGASAAATQRRFIKATPLNTRTRPTLQSDENMSA